MRIAKEARTAESKKQLFSKQNRTVRDVMDERDAGHGWLSAHGDPAVEIFWDWNDAVHNDQIVKLRVINKPGKYTDVVLDAEELMKYLRWV